MKHQLFLDLDGVLVDFDRGVREATGKAPEEQSPRSMWPILARTKDFYNKLRWMADGRELWNSVRHLNPVILTGLPMGKWAEDQKRRWCARELGEDVAVITGMSRKKANLAIDWMIVQGQSDLIPVLVDDRLKIQEPWEAAGGVFILHLDTRRSLEALAELGLLV